MHVYIENQQSDLTIDPKQAIAIARSVVSLEKKSFDEVALHFVTKEAISTLHSEYMGDSSPTDCLSFPVVRSQKQSPYRLMGDVFVCPAVAAEYAREHKIDPYEETTLYIVHGLLHLLGYDDIDKEEKLKMRAAEKKHLDNLRNKRKLLTSS